MTSRLSHSRPSPSPTSSAPRRRRFPRAIAALGVCLSTGAATAQITSGCQQSPTVVPVRSLQQSGKVSFVCLAPTEPSERPLAECTAQQFTSVCQYEYETDAGVVDADVVRDDAGVPIATMYPHLYALVTQVATGEVAVVDTSSLANPVLDEDPLEPGANFLHVGDQPQGIASTPGSVATFVGTAEVGRAGIFAIPSSMIRPATSFGIPDTCSGDSDAGAFEIPQLSSWPACALPAAPGDILLVDDPAITLPANSAGNTGNQPLTVQRASCDGTYSVRTDGSDATFTGTIAQREGSTGRPKLVVAIPDYNGEGGIAIFDAQTIFSMTPGQFGPCPIERWVPLKVDLAGLDGQPQEPTGVACSNPKQNTPALAPLCPPGTGLLDGGASAAPPTCYRAQPSGLSYADGKLYVADVGAPVIHVVDMHDSQGNPTPCNPVEQAPLLPYSAEEPERVVFAGKVTAASQLTPDFKRYLYATDETDASAMIFDIGPDSTTRRPLTRANPEWDPFHPRDRVKFTAPPKDIIIVQRDAPNIDPVTGLAPSGVLCDPDPNAISCTTNSHNCDPGTAYQPASDYSSGAGPLKLRGEFAFAALSNGKLAVIDISDFDSPCRGPTEPSTLAGCSANGPPAIPTTAATCDYPPFPKTTYEQSCGIVSRAEARSAYIEAAGTFAGNHVPGVLTYPLLYQTDGSVFPSTGAPQMVATLPTTIPPACNTAQCNSTTCTTNSDSADSLPGCPLELMIGGALQPIDTATGAYASCSLAGGEPAADPTLAGNNSLLMNLQDPRAHVVDQNWTVTFEGSLPGFSQRFAYLSSGTSGSLTLTDPNSRFCDFGVLGQNAFADQLTAKGMDPNKSPSAADFADYVQITNELTSADDPYWTGSSTSCNPMATYGNCFASFGSTEQVELDTSRDFLIVEAYEDHVELMPRGATDLDLLQCCFPTGITFNVRTGNQWAVVGDQSGFLHHVVADKDTGVCRNNCDGNFQRMNARLVTGPKTGTVVNDRLPSDIDPLPAFMNPMFRFAIEQAATTCKKDDDCTGQTGISTSAVVACVAGACTPGRNSQFRFTTNQSFSPMLVALTTDATQLIEPTSVSYIGATQEVAVTDGYLNGLILVSLQTGVLSRSFF